MSLQKIHDNASEVSKQLALEGLGKEIAHHLSCGAINHREFAGVDAIGDKIILTVDVLGALAA